MIGVLPEDAPDPRVETNARLRGIRFPVFGLVAQPSVQDDGAVGFQEMGYGGDAGAAQIAVSCGYTLWRNREDRDDPVNLAELVESTRRSIEEVPPWPRPRWLLEYVERMRYPFLWEAVRTNGAREAPESAGRQLVAHANHILRNQFREELGLGPGPESDAEWEVRESAVNSRATLEIDGVEVPALEIDTDPFVYAIGAQLQPDLVATVVIAREHLPYLRLALQTRQAAEG